MPIAALLAMLLLACAPAGQQADGQQADGMSEPGRQAPAVPAPGINAAYLDPALDVDRLARGFSAESREVFAAREAVTRALPLERGDTVADIGAGTGIYIEPFAEAVGPEGTVYAVDIARPLLAHIDALAAERGLAQVRTILGSQDSTTLPAESVDVAFTSDVYHHFEKPAQMNAHIRDLLRPGGTYAILDFKRGPAAEDWIKRHVRGDMATVISEVTAAGFHFSGEVPVKGLEENYLILFTKTEN